MTSNALTLVFDRLQQRAGLSDKPVSPQGVRDTFAMRYLQEGGRLQALGERLGLRDWESLKRYAPLGKQRSQHNPQQEPPEMQGATSRTTPQKRLRRRRRSSSAVSRKARRTDAGNPASMTREESAPDRVDDP